MYQVGPWGMAGITYSTVVKILWYVALYVFYQMMRCNTEAFI